MKHKIILTVAILGLTGMGATTTAQAFFGNMMNPNKWFDDDDDRYWRRGYYGGGYGPYGWGGGPYGPYGGYGGYGPYGGWGGGPWGYGGQPSTIVVNPDSGKKAPPPKLPE